MKTSNTYKVPLYLCNEYRYLKMRYLLFFMSDLAYYQASLVEKDTMPENGRWIVYSWDVKIDESIKENDELFITTSAINMKKFYAYRNFEIKRDGKMIGKAYCVFLLMDIKRLRPIKIPQALADSYGEEKSIYDGKEVSFSENFEIEKKIPIRKNDLDFNMHVNNAAYLELIREIVDIDDQDIEYFKIVYRNEIRNKDFVIGKAHMEESEGDFKLLSEDNKVYTYGKIVKR